MQKKELKLHFDEDKGKKIVFDQPYYYYAPPQGGQYDQNGYYRFKDGAFLNNQGYFFNNMGYDRYGGCLDKNFDYYIKDEKDITSQERSKVTQYPQWESSPGYDDNQQGGYDQNEDEKYNQYDERQFREDQNQYNQYDDQQEGEGGDDIFFKRQPANVKYQLKGAKAQHAQKQQVVRGKDQTKNPSQSKKKSAPGGKAEQKKTQKISQISTSSKPKIIKNEKMGDDDWDFD